MIQLNAATRLQAADKAVKKTVKEWLGTNGRFADVVVLAEVVLAFSKTKSESVTVNPGEVKSAKNIVANKACTFEDCETWIIMCIQGVEENGHDAVAGARATLKSAKTDYKNSGA